MIQPDHNVKASRPALIWVTLLLVGAFALLALYAMLRLSMLIPQAIDSTIPWRSVASGFAYASIELAALATLFVGLIRARRWAWYCGILFAVLLLVLVLYSRALHAADAAKVPYDQLVGAAISELVITFLLVLYPFRLYFSKSVRAYFLRA